LVVDTESFLLKFVNILQVLNPTKSGIMFHLVCTAGGMPRVAILPVLLMSNRSQMNEPKEK